MADKRPKCKVCHAQHRTGEPHYAVAVGKSGGKWWAASSDASEPIVEIIQAQSENRKHPGRGGKRAGAGRPKQ